MATTNYSGLSQRTTAWAAKEMLAHAEPIEVLSKFGLAKPVPKNTSEQVKFRRPVPFSAATTALTEGTPPTSLAMSYEDVTATLAQYGSVIEITDKVTDLAEDPVLKDASMLAGEQAGETVETLTWNVIKAGTSVRYANGVAGRSTVAAAPSLTDQRAITRTIKGNKGRKITSMVGGSPNYTTEPVDAAYIAFAHTDLESDIRDMTGFVPVEKYGQMKAMPYEVGKVEDVRYICSPTLTMIAAGGGASSVDVYGIVYIAKEAFGCITLKGANAIKPMVLNPGTPRGGDPLGQKGTVGWKTYFVAKMLNEGWAVRLECALG